MKSHICIFWFRRDLRLEDNIGLSAALASGTPVLPLFIFDSDILDDLPSPYDRRVDYIHQALQQIDNALADHGSALMIRQGRVVEIFSSLLTEYTVEAVYCNRDYEPQAIARDVAVRKLLQDHGIDFRDFKDQVIFEKGEICKEDGSPYTVYSPYARKWRAQLAIQSLEPKNYDPPRYVQRATELPSLAELGFEKTDLVFGPPSLDEHLIATYGQYRDYPALEHSSMLGIALRFGTISIRRCVAFAREKEESWLAQLIWREFFMQILYHFPHVVDQAFKSQYDRIEWRNNVGEFKRWCAGETGYPLVDAGMKQLLQTGHIHNRVRMLVASFLCKHLLIDWRWGEAYFAEKLNDYDLAANNGNWQWAAGSGCDAAPYFRIFNPSTQAKKFDQSLEYIRRWNPGFERSMQAPIVNHELARMRALNTYKRALAQ